MSEKSQGGPLPSRMLVWSSNEWRLPSDNVRSERLSLMQQTRISTLNIRILAAFLSLSTFVSRPACAENAEDYFKGKQITIVVAYGSGTYDLYARLIAPFLKRHLPGQPTVIVQNMPGAGGVKAARYLLEVAPKDGTTLGVLAQTIAFDTLLGFSEGVDAGQFNWLGRIGTNEEVGVAGGQSGIRNFEDARAKEVSVGGTGGTASSTALPYLLTKLASAKFKLISGYRSANEALLALERGEIDMVGAFGMSGLERIGPKLTDGSIRPIYLSALGRNPRYPDLPTIGELGRDDEAKQILDLFASNSAVGRTVVAPPGIPQARIAVLRAGIAAAMSDSALLTFAAERNMPLEPAESEEIEAIVRKILATPPTIAKKAAEVLNTLKTSR